MLSNLFTKMSKSCPDVSNKIITNLACTDCSEETFGGAGNNLFVDLKTHKPNEDLAILVNKLEEKDFNQNSNIFFLSSNIGMKLRLSKPIKFHGKSLRCRAIISETGYYFSSNGMWYQVGNETITSFHDEVVSNVLMVSYEADVNIYYTNEESIIYEGAEYIKISQLGDRHLDTQERKKDRHLDKNFRGNSQTWKNLKEDINNDTGMDVICCSCLEMKSRRSCVSVSNLSEELVTKYCYQKERTRSKDGKFYVCLTCQIPIKADKEPTRALKELIGFLDFPEGNIYIIIF